MEEVAKNTIKYDMSIDDLTAFSLYYARSSPALRSTQRRYAMVWLPILFMATLALGFKLPDASLPMTPLILAVSTTVIMAGYLAYYFKYGWLQRYRRVIGKLYAEGKSPGLVGEHTLEIDENGITERTEFKETRHAWGGLVRIESEPGYTYLFTGASSAIIIPHQSITDGNFPALLEQVKLHYRPDAKISA